MDSIVARQALRRPEVWLFGTVTGSVVRWRRSARIPGRSSSPSMPWRPPC